MEFRKVVCFGILLAIAYIVPVSVFAKTYNYPNDVKNALYGSDNQDVVEFSPGDEIVFDNTKSYSYYNIYIDEKKVGEECYGYSCPSYVYTVENKMYFSYGKSEKINFITKEESTNVYSYSNSIRDKYFKSGDFIIFKGLDYHNNGINPRIYDKNDSLLYYIDTEQFAFGQYYSFGNENRGYLLLKLPKIGGKDMYWKISIFNDGGYGYPSPHFTPFDYSEPKIELKCDKDKIKFGEKAKCEVCLECTHVLSKLEFSMNQKDLKFSNFSFPNGITNSGNNNSIKLNITDNNICNEKKTIMSFDVESTKDTNYLDTITLKDLAYTDEVLTGNYKNLDSNLNIISVKNNISNPKTGIRLLFVLFPIILFSIIGVLSLIRRKNYEK